MAEDISLSTPSSSGKISDIKADLRSIRDKERRMQRLAFQMSRRTVEVISSPWRPGISFWFDELARKLQGPVKDLQEEADSAAKGTSSKEVQTEGEVILRGPSKELSSKEVQTEGKDQDQGEPATHEMISTGASKEIWTVSVTSRRWLHHEPKQPPRSQSKRMMSQRRLKELLVVPGPHKSPRRTLQEEGAKRARPKAKPEWYPEFT